MISCQPAAAEPRNDVRMHTYNPKTSDQANKLPDHAVCVSCRGLRPDAQTAAPTLPCIGTIGPAAPTADWLHHGLLLQAASIHGSFTIDQRKHLRVAQPKRS